MHEIWQALYSPVCIFKIIFSSSIISCNCYKYLLIDFHQNNEITCRTNTPRKQGGLGNMKIPLLADKTMEISRAYGVLKEDDGISFRWDTCQSKPLIYSSFTFSIGFECPDNLMIYCCILMYCAPVMNWPMDIINFTHASENKFLVYLRENLLNLYWSNLELIFFIKLGIFANKYVDLEISMKSILF